MGIFTKLNELREFEKSNLRFLLTVEDFDIVRTIGLYQERGQPLLLKQLFLEDIGSFSTLTRRLTKLREAGHVLVREHGPDRRAIALRLSPSVNKIYLAYEKLLRTRSR